MPFLYILVGVPASGKTTWSKREPFGTAPNTLNISTDHYVEQHAKAVGKTYNEVFEEYMPTAVRKMADSARWAFDNEYNVIWDQTSTTASTRAKKLRMAPEHYIKIAVVFETPHSTELFRRVTARPGKNIPREVLDSMIAKFEMPTKEEGFSEIWKICS